MNMLTRKGVAKKLMQRVLQEAQERDVHNIISYVRNDNKVRADKYNRGNLNEIHFHRLLSTSTRSLALESRATTRGTRVSS